VLVVADLADGRAALDADRRISPDFSRTARCQPSRPVYCAELPAARASWPPLPGFSSMLWTTEPTGMLRSNIALPGLIGESAPEWTSSPTDRPFGARM
jgi:hypothetical protein